jgi:uncharacterized protein (UPF0262 family)
MKTRNGERYFAHKRSVTIFKTFDGWYFKTREQVDFGPYHTRQQAICARLDFINQMLLCKSAVQPAITPLLASISRNTCRVPSF